MTTILNWRGWRVWLAERIAGPDYLVVSQDVFDGLLGAHCDQVVRMVAHAVQNVPELFSSAPGKPETRH